MPGFLDVVTITIDNVNTPWEIQLYKDEVDVAQVPHVVTVSCTFLPIMDILPARVTLERPTVPLIGNVPKNTFLNNIKDTTRNAI